MTTNLTRWTNGAATLHEKRIEGTSLISLDQRSTAVHTLISFVSRESNSNDKGTNTSLGAVQARLPSFVDLGGREGGNPFFLYQRKYSVIPPKYFDYFVKYFKVST
jgi:hypothetical protein